MATGGTNGGTDVFARVIAGLALAWSVVWSLFTYFRARPRVSLEVDSYVTCEGIPYWTTVLGVTASNRSPNPVTVAFWHMEIISSMSGNTEVLRSAPGKSKALLQWGHRLGGHDSIMWWAQPVVWGPSAPNRVLVRLSVELGSRARPIHSRSFWIPTFPQDPATFAIKEYEVACLDGWERHRPSFRITEMPTAGEWKFRFEPKESQWVIARPDGIEDRVRAAEASVGQLPGCRPGVSRRGCSGGGAMAASSSFRSTANKTARRVVAAFRALENSGRATADAQDAVELVEGSLEVAIGMGLEPGRLVRD